MTRKRCADCLATTAGDVVRDLCSRCYQRHRKHGTLGEFDRLAPPSDEAVTVEGISYRQLDYWVRRGFLRLPPGRGPGVTRVWPPEEIAVAKIMALVDR